MSLVIVDLFIGLFILLMWIYELGLGVLWYLKMVYYGFLVFFVIDIFINLVLILNLIVIFLERLYVILFLWWYCVILRVCFWLFIFVVWMLLVVCLVLYIIVGFVVLLVLGILCIWLFYFCFLLFVICVLYIVIFLRMWRCIYCGLYRECRLIIILFIVIVFFFVVYLLMVVFGVLYFVFGKSMNSWFINVLSFFNFGNLLVNLILYFFRMLDFRRVVCLFLWW